MTSVWAERGQAPAFAMTEPDGAGSDPEQLRTAADFDVTMDPNYARTACREVQAGGSPFVWNLRCLKRQPSRVFTRTSS